MSYSRSAVWVGGKAGTEISVLHVIGSLAGAKGGTSRCVPDLCLNMAAAGLGAGIAFIKGEEEISVEAQRLPGHGVHCYPLRPWSAPWTLWRVIRRCDVVHVNGVWSFLPFLGCLFAHLQHKPLVVTPHGMLEPWALGEKRLKKARFLDIPKMGFADGFGIASHGRHGSGSFSRSGTRESLGGRPQWRPDPPDQGKAREGKRGAAFAISFTHSSQERRP